MIELTRSSPAVGKLDELLDVAIRDEQRALATSTAKDLESRRYLEFIQHQRRCLGLLEDSWSPMNPEVSLRSASLSELEDWVARLAREEHQQEAAELLHRAAIEILRSLAPLRAFVLPPHHRPRSPSTDSAGRIVSRIRQVLARLWEGSGGSAIDAARELLVQAREADPARGSVHVDLGWAAWFGGDPQEAGRQFEESVRRAKASSQRSNALSNLSLWVNEHGSPGIAERLALSAVELDGSSAPACFNYVVWAYLSGYSRRAEELLKAKERTLQEGLFRKWPFQRVSEVIQGNAALREAPPQTAQELENMLEARFYQWSPRAMDQS